MSSSDTLHGAIVSFRPKAKACCSAGVKLDQSSPASRRLRSAISAFGQAGDFPVHLAVAHAVRALDRAGDDPEEALAEDPVVLRRGLGPGGAHEDFERDGQFGCIAEDDAIPDDVARLLDEALGQVPGDLVPRGDAQAGRLAALEFELFLERLIRDLGPLRIVARRGPCPSAWAGPISGEAVAASSAW